MPYLILWPFPSHHRRDGLGDSTLSIRVLLIVWRRNAKPNHNHVAEHCLDPSRASATHPNPARACLPRAEAWKTEGRAGTTGIGDQEAAVKQTGKLEKARPRQAGRQAPHNLKFN